MSETNLHGSAYLRAATAPSEEQKRRLTAFLREKYGTEPELIFERDERLGTGFRLSYGDEVFDWSPEGRFRQLREALLQAGRTGGRDVIPLLKETAKNWVPAALAQQVGSVRSVGDGIAVVDGLHGATFGEILLFSGGVRGMVQDLREDSVGCILFDDGDEVYAGSSVYRTGRTAGIPVGSAFIGRVVNALGVPVDGLGEIDADAYRPVEHPAPGIVDRQPVCRPLQTGILAIDSMFPIGRGQRELIIGDRQTGKTAIALDTILNQKDQDVICIYVSIGQKASTVAKLTDTLRAAGAMEYTVVLHTSASDAAPLQYLAPYAGCALGEYFMEQGKDVLIVYDDLSKHAVAYRALSLLLDRSPGREAYPGDVFYLHSRLLERSAHLSQARGGGSMTALPIVETQAGDVAAYIPTNIISITDGQIFLESNLFFAGQRPAVNVGLSVSRVGGDAQTKAMKKAAGTLRLDLAQYREMEVFTQFAGDLDESTLRQLQYGEGLMALLRQPQYQPYRQHEQVILLTAALAHLLEDADPAQIPDLARELLDRFHGEQGELCARLDSTGLLTDSDKEEILSFAKRVLAARKA